MILDESKGQILADEIEPLKIIPAKIILNAYNYNKLSINLNLNDTRGIPIYRFNDIFYENTFGSNLIIEDNGKVKWKYEN